jgi:hypothetical protein
MVLNDLLYEVLPDDFLARAHRAECGDLSWAGADASAVAAFLLTLELVVIGGEKYDLFPGAYWGTFAGAFSTIPPAGALQGRDIADACISELELILMRERELRKRRYWLAASNRSQIFADDTARETSK